MGKVYIYNISNNVEYIVFAAPRFFMIIKKFIMTFISGPKPVMRVPPEQDNLSQEKYDSYLTKLQNICTEQVGEEGGVKPVTESLKSALQNISVLPTPTWKAEAVDSLAKLWSSIQLWVTGRPESEKKEDFVTKGGKWTEQNGF